MGIAVILSGSVVLVAAQRFMRSQLLKPAFVILKIASRHPFSLYVLHLLLFFC